MKRPGEEDDSGQSLALLATTGRWSGGRRSTKRSKEQSRFPGRAEMLG